MGKLYIMTDSNSGITQKEANELGIDVVAMPFFINKQEYLEDITLSQEEFFEKLKDDETDVSTSQPSIGLLTERWDELLKEYDEILFIPMSSGLSRTCETATIMAQNDYEGKVFVVNNQRISVTQKQSVFDAIELAKRGLSGKRIKEILEETKFDSLIFITVDTLKYLKKGGRLTPAVALIGTLLKIKPVLVIRGEKLDSYKKTRKMKEARQIMIEAIKDYVKDNVADYHYFVAYTNNRNDALDYSREIEEYFNEKVIHTDPLSLSVACHIGEGALAIAATKKLDYDSYK